MSSAEQLHDSFRDRLLRRAFPPGEPATGELSGHGAVAIYRAQCVSRHLDRIARRLQKAGRAYYSIGSSGHEGMAAVAHALRVDDMAFLHYRDAAFQVQRSMRVPGSTPIHDLLLSFTCAKADPIAGGRHKVLGSRALNIPPQTSTIASHLPKAVGAAFSINLLKRSARAQRRLHRDGLVLCSFGDASCNHSTAQGAFNTAAWCSFRDVPLPLLFVCEDNGIGISVPSPPGWIRASFRHRPGLRYFSADGLNMYDTWRVAGEAAAYVRTERKPAFLHLSVVRLLGHAGSDAESAYRSAQAIAADEDRDPLLHSARLLVENDALDASRLLALYDEVGRQCEAIAATLLDTPRLSSAAEVMASLVPPARAPQAEAPVDPAQRRAAFGRDWDSLATAQPMARLLNWTLTDLMLADPGIFLVGQDIGRKGGVYGVTQRLLQRLGRERVIDSLLDEQSILGLAIGAAHNGLLPIPEIQFLAYLHNAEDQLRGEAATLSFFSNGQFTNPLVVRVAGLGYQRGFGGHFHNDNSLAVLRDVPGLILCCPSNGRDAALLLRECVRLARQEQRVVVFLEPIALYGTRDLDVEGDGAWAHPYPAPTERAAYGEVAVCEGTEMAIVSYGNGFFLTSQAATVLEAERGIRPRLIDLRWLQPLPLASLLGALKGIDRILIVDECRRSGNVAEGLVTALHEAGHHRMARLSAEDSFIATGPAYAATMPSRDSIVAAALALLGAAP
jgi:2-oxoisovalerate dehydrogenase E1 component